MKEEYFGMVAKTLYGLEDVLAEELNTIGAGDVEAGRRMVSFTGDKAILYKANFYCRTALRILKPVAVFKANHADVVYQEVKSIDWEKYLSPDKTFAVDAVVYSEIFNHSKFVAYRTKDAIVDHFNDKYEKRPSVRVNNPDVYINIHISHNECTVSLDSSGESLHKRGYRVAQVDAPLNEALAAGMILKTGWRGESNFIDPMCGSGTLLIEATMIALNIAPGVYRKEYAFERWPDFDRDLFDEIYNDESAEREFQYKCYGSDISPLAIEKARQNVRSAGLSKYIELKIMPFQQYTEAPEPGISVMNPPYGERISANDILELYGMIGERLKHVFSGYNAWILSYKDECFDKIGLRPKERMKLMNGDLECEYRCYELFEGKNKDYKKEQKEGGGDRNPKRSENGERRGVRGDRQSEGDGLRSWPGGKDRDSAGRRGERSGGSREGRADSKEGFEKRGVRNGGRERRNERPGGFGRNRDENASFRNKKFAEERLAGKDRKPYERKDRSPGGGRSSFGDKKPFNKDRKPFDKEHRPFDKEKKSFEGSRKSFDRDRKPFKKADKYFDRNRKSFKDRKYED
ncbi:MAG: THUMP domain-containing protein [Tannerella sp.]|jgi:putative N6-adenine-specific DNA methylase|nr:THUMP domain-containing protein [Tannerella sp.]